MKSKNRNFYSRFMMDVLSHYDSGEGWDKMEFLVGLSPCLSYPKNRFIEIHLTEERDRTDEARVISKKTGVDVKNVYVGIVAILVEGEVEGLGDMDHLHGEGWTKRNAEGKRYIQAELASFDLLGPIADCPLKQSAYAEHLAEEKVREGYDSETGFAFHVEPEGARENRYTEWGLLHRKEKPMSFFERLLRAL